MVKEKTIFICEACGARFPAWQGKCGNCGEWNTLKEQRVAGAAAKRSRASVMVKKLSEFTDTSKKPRFHTGLGEFDVVLGGGMVPGSLILLGGDPGIGKSTLALQTALHLSEQGENVLYISGEESGQQVKMRAARISKHISLPVLPETSLENVLQALVQEHPDLAIIDSIQTLNSEEIAGSGGGVAQITYATNALMRCAKENNITIILIGHVTKEGNLAGPRMLEHMVDTVLYLEGERSGVLKLLRCVKNRFGSTGEVGIFELGDEGLKEVKNPSLYLLGDREKNYSGVCRAAILEGNKVLLTQIEALTAPVAFGYPQRKTSGFDNNRLQLLCAILQKRLGVNLQSYDVFLNVAGGFTLEERAADLPAALAILSSLYDTALPQDLVAFGEIGLSGEIRVSPQADKRMRECQKLEFKKVAANAQIKSPHGRSVASSGEARSFSKAAENQQGLDMVVIKEIHEVKKLFPKLR
ncbi:MAG TPA: DNA repair protein RadA [Patescibacteria group bacterium]|nr:DNA repair protein RadA [Patescibacteria group bacterium]